MATVNSSTGSTSSSGSSKLTFSGLASGLDTESIVKSLMTNHQSKIDKANQKKQLLEWKQSAYRNTTKLINDFKTKYLDSLGTNYIGSSSFFTSKTITESSDALVAEATTSAQNGTILINSATMATSADLTSTSKVSPALTGGVASFTGSAKIQVSLDGVTKEIEFSDPASLQSALNNTFGSGKVSVSLTDGKYTFDTADSTSKLTLLTSNDTAHANDLTNLGFTSGQSNHISTSTKINSLIDFGASSTYSLKINNVDITLNSTDTVSQVMSRINSSNAGVTMSYSSFSDKFSLTSKLTGESAKVDVADTGGKFLNGLFGVASTTATKSGTDATISVTANGATQSITRSSNTFEISGVNITINKDITEAATIGVSSNSDTALKNMKSFIADYNALVNAVNSTTQESYNKNYPPLTDAQKKEMSETEITDWEKKAKVGLLSGDNELRSFISDLRDVLYSSVKSSGLSAYQIGIDTTDAYNDGGQLKLDETKFKKALEENSQGVTDLFTNSDTGLESKYEKLLNSYASPTIFNTGKTDSNGKSIFSYGSLVELAGYSSGVKNSKNDISEDITDINENISELKTKYDDEYDRLWAKFSSLESSISKLNSQSSYLSSMFS